MTMGVVAASPALAGPAQSVPGSVDGGHDHSVLVTKPDSTGYNEVYASGSNAVGQLGNNSTVNSTVFTKVRNLTRVKAVSANVHYSLALKADGTVWAWGQGNLGNGSTQSSVPVQVSGITNAVAIDAGAAHAVAVLSDGTVKAWGSNSHGQLGNGTTTASATPVTVTGLTGAATTYGAAAAGLNHSVVVLADGTVKAWGKEDMLGIGAEGYDPVTSPVSVPGLTGVAEASAKFTHTLVRLSAGTVKGWGNDWNGNLGDGTGSPDGWAPTPVNAIGLTAVQGLATGQNHSAVLRTNSGGGWEVWNMGYSFGHTPISANHSAPGGPAAIGAGSGAHTLVTHPDGSAWGRGDNSTGELGVGDTTARNTFTAVLETWSR
ncbi:RCC1 domain-containing protein [Thermomonospora umbrina]|nr:hypothetical protein [Thermomonospora umbrina]